MKFVYDNPEDRKTKLSAEIRRETIAGAIDRDERLRTETNSTAHRFAIGANLAEDLIRDIIAKRGAGTIRDLSGAREPIRSDGRIAASPYEIKCGGNLGRPAKHVGWFDESDIYPSAKYIVWCLYEKVHDTDDLVDWTVVLDREYFLELLEAVSRKGLHGTLALKKNGSNGSDRAENLVMAFQPVPLRKLRERIEAELTEGDLQSLRTWLQDNERQGW